jgi:hypothetical protein
MVWVTDAAYLAKKIITDDQEISRARDPIRQA